MSNLGAKGFNPKKGSMPALNYMPPAMLSVDPAYQRSIENTASQALIQHIAKNWNWDLCQPLVVNRREDGTLAVADGQHRLTAANLRGDIDVLPCVVCNLPDLASEAELFVQFNRSRKTLTKHDLWKAAITSGEKLALQINDALDAADLKISSSTRLIGGPSGQVSNIAGLYRVLKRQGFEQLCVATDILGKAYRSEVLQYCGTIFSGIAAIVADAYPPSESSKGGGLGQRTSMLVDCIAARPQAEWFRLVQTAIADGSSRIDATDQIFRNAWKIWQDKAPQPTVAAPAPPFAVARPLPTLSQAAADRPFVKPQPPKKPATPAPEHPSFEEQLRRVAAGEVGIAEKIGMPRGGDDRTLGGVVGEINN